mmetsp:Transcript_11962/g.26235  ORF Transcript_11962/g.26235 Transcript_11962/m.26235 type:complete len:123 (-) Transcript_11962:20-388(-)
MAKAGRKSHTQERVKREYTIHMHKHLHGRCFKRRAPFAIKVIKKFAEKMMKTKDVRIEAELNKAVWARGVRNVEKRLRVCLERKRNEDKDAGERLYTVASFVPMGRDGFKGLGVTNKELADE